jgi:sugar lactone lactonase YvrE
MMIRSGLAAIGAGLALTAGVIAQPEIYIPEYAFNDAVMTAMRLDGSNRRVLFNLAPSQWLPIGVAFNPASGRLIWTDSANGSEIVSATLNGGGLTNLRSYPGFGKGASLDSLGRIYFAADTRIHRLNADGSGLVTLFTSNSQFPVHPPRVDARNGHLYFGDDGRIVRTNLEGGNLRVLTTGVSQARAITLDLARRHIYWLDVDTISDHLARSNLDGSGFTVLADFSPSVVQSGGLNDVLLDPVSDRIFVTDDLANRVYALNRDGTGLTVLHQSTRSPIGIALSTGDPLQSLNDCDGNGIADDLDIAAGVPDCDGNGVPDPCQTDPCPTLDLLLDQGSSSARSDGRALGTSSQWQVFQPFLVPAGGWRIGMIGVDGFTVNYHNGSGFIARIYRDDGSTERPDESEILATSDPLNLRFNTFRVNWVYAELHASLDEGLYWVRLEGVDPNTFQSSVNYGFSGLASRSRGISGNFSDFVGPIALRLIRGTPPCEADYNGDGFLDFFDYDDFVACFEGVGTPGCITDFNDDGFVDFFDYDAFVAAFESGC